MHRRTQSDAQATIFSKFNPAYKIKAKKSCNQIENLIKKSNEQNKFKVTFIQSLNSSQIKNQGNLFQFGRLSNIGNSYQRPHYQNNLDTILQRRALNHNNTKNTNKQNTTKGISKADKQPQLFKMVIPQWIRSSKFEDRRYHSQRQTPKRERKMVQKQALNYLRIKQKLKPKPKKMVETQNKSKKITEKKKKL